MITGAQAMVKCLESEGVSVVFGYPGAAICPFYDSLTASAIRHILIRQEQNGGHSANGYARIAGKPGVCIATSGPGATNLITALATAYMDSIPVVAITGQVATDVLGRDVFQEADITGAAEPFTKHSYLVKDVNEIPRIFKEAFYIAATGRPGPVLIDVPVDIQRRELTKEFEYPRQVHIIGYKPSIKGHNLQIKKVADALSAAQKPLICVGGGAFAAGGYEMVRKLSEEYGIPAISTMMGIGVFPTSHPLYMGMLGMHGARHANQIVRQADLLLIIGARVGDRAVSSPDVISPSTTIVHIDIDPAEIGKNIGTAIPLVGDCRTVIQQLMEHCDSHTRPGDFSQWVRYAQGLRDEYKPDLEPREYGINPKYFLRCLSEKMPGNAVYVADVGQNQIWSANHINIKKGRFLTSGGMGTMGYSIPAAVGAKLADPGREVIAGCGDGAFQMQMMELATICQDKVGIKIIVFRNRKLGMVKEIQKKSYGCRYIATSLEGDPDFTILASAYGIPSERVEAEKEIDGAIGRLLAAEGPYLLECVVDPEESSI